MNEKTDKNSYPSSSPYASTVTDNGFSFTWSGHDIASRQGVYLHNAPYSGMWEIPYGLGSYSNPVEQPNSAWPTDPETPESYTTPSQSYVDDLDAFFYGYDNSDLFDSEEDACKHLLQTVLGDLDYFQRQDVKDWYAKLLTDPEYME